MSLDPAVLQSLTVRVQLNDYVRIMPKEHAATPLGMGYGKSRFSSPRNKFKLLYLAQNVKTAVAETIVRDRFEGSSERLVFEEEFSRYCITGVRSLQPLLLLDLRHEGASLLGIPTDAVRARAQAQGRRFSQMLYDQTSLDGSIYMSRITNRTCVALYDRAVSKLAAETPATPITTLKSLESVISDLRIVVLKSP